MNSTLNFIFLLCFSIGFSQNQSVGIFTNQPQAALDIDGSDYGVVFPKINLTNNADQTSVKNPKSGANLAKGTIIWNTANNNNLIPGFYIWQNNKWKRVLNKNTISQHESNGFNNPDFDSQSCDVGIWTELVSSLGTAIVFNEEEIASASFYYNQPPNYICDIEVILNFKSKHTKALEIFLKAPTGEIIELMDDAGPTIALEGIFNSKFTSYSSNTLDSWNGINKTFSLASVKPKGISNPSLLSSHFSKSSISSFTELINKNPQGEWEIIINNRSGSYTMDVSDLKLRIKAREDHSNSGNYKLAEQIAYSTKNSKSIIINSIFEGQIKSDILHTAITKTTSPLIINSTNNINVLDVKNVNTKMNSGISWLQSNNQFIDSNIPENSTFYYQLWYKGDVQHNTIKHNITITNF